MIGRRLVGVEVTHPRTARHNASPDEVVAKLKGRGVESVRRLGKYLVFDLDDGHQMVAHLGMSGRFSVVSGTEPRERHTHFVADLDDGTQIRFTDPRTFGFVAVYDEDELGRSAVARLGPDAWESPPDSADLANRLSGRKAPIKALLLDQRPLAGLGNIYADEALHKAGIHPLTPGGSIPEGRLAILLQATREVLEEAIGNGGTTLADVAYLLPDGRAGDNLGHLSVYGMEGEECITCGSVIERIVLRGRSTHFCPGCQGGL